MADRAILPRHGDSLVVVVVVVLPKETKKKAFRGKSRSILRGKLLRAIG